MVDMKLSFDPMTIEHLGFKMYSHLPNAVAELVANSYDADATYVRVVLYDDDGRSVEVVDDGHGMSDEDLGEKYLRIGRNRRSEDGGTSESGHRRVAGRKGLGKLALFGIGDRVSVRTKRADTDMWTRVSMDWHDLKATKGEYRPPTDHEPGDLADHGTSIRVEALRRRTAVDARSLARSLARLFQHVDADFKLSVVGVDGHEVEVTRDLRYELVEVETSWRIPEDIDAGGGFAREKDIHGEIFATVKPLPAEMRGVTLYVHGRLAHEPEYFGVPESSYAFSYITGYIEVDYVDDLDEDIIATDRRSLSWESAEGEQLRDYLDGVIRQVADLRRGTRTKAKKERLQTDLGVDSETWVATIRGPEASSVRDVLDLLTSSDSEIGDDDRTSLVVGLSELAPEYADMHWRHLHPRIAEVAEDFYTSEKYMAAVLEAAKRYVADVRAAAPDTANLKERDVLTKALRDDGELNVFTKWAGSGFSPETEKNIRTAQRELSLGVQQGFRNPLAHEEMVRLDGEGVFTYQDCLDALSIISHLRRRLDDAGSPA
ncbi:TIGR02391 family protein [Cellulomonas sp.]|uniref:TIGR02391 family protein n=1 Tax=Cellulomonas sp. TaxID=40001 RepID=UPI001B1FCAE8|nr:TIGR02391 family protein [Cellulomonas sp.]MBO9556701.1 TIGR02391 family protein [Cellulomonas sp.]